MQNRDNNFETLIGHAKSMLGCSYEGLKRKYLHYPISLTVHVDKKTDTFEQFIEIRFSEQEATISLNFDQTDSCNAAYLFFDTQNDENNFIKYLTESYDFDFRKNCWLLENYYLKVTNIKDIFCFYFFR